VVAYELYFAYGVLVNDYFDRQVDIQAGKSSARRGHTLTERELAAVMAFQLATSAVVIAAIRGGVVFDLLWVLAFALATMYSAPPARLRAKGFAGFLVDSLIEKPIPILIAFSLFGYFGFETILFPIFGEMLDSIFKHQVEDFDSDTKLKVRTFAVELGKQRSAWIERVLVHPINALAVLSFFGIAYAMLPAEREVTLVLSILLAIGLFAFIALQRRGRVRPGFPFPEPPIVGYLNFGFRTLLLGGLAAAIFLKLPGNYPFAVLVLLSIIVYLKGYARLIPDFLGYLASSRWRRTSTSPAEPSSSSS
jgi:4-hydroxybenzoate polyprenyltransferase